MNRPAIQTTVLALLGIGLAFSSLSGAPLERVAPRLWIEKPVVPCQELVQSDSMYLCSTTITARHVFLLADGRLLVGDGYSILVYEPSLKLAGICLELSKKAGLTGPGQEYDFILPDPDNRSVAVGFADPGRRGYRLGVVNLPDLEYTETVYLTRARKVFRLESDKDRQSDNPSRTSPDSGTGSMTPLFYDGETLALKAAFPPPSRTEYLLRLNLPRKTLESTPFPGRSVLAWNSDPSLLFSAQGNPDRLFWQKTGRIVELSGSFVPGSAGFDRKGRPLFQEKTEGGTAFLLFDPIREEKDVLLELPAARFQAWGSVLHRSANGNRLFFTGILDGRRGLYVSELSEKGPLLLAGNGDLDTPAEFSSCGDGEFFCYLPGNVLHVGYLEDRSAPDLSVRMEPLYQGAALAEELSILPECRDATFTSGCDDGSIRVTVNERPVGRGEKATLKPGLNTVKVTAADRAGNRALLEKSIELLDVPLVTLEMIATTPQAYHGRLVSLEGLIWGWAATGMEESERSFSAGKRFFPANQPTARNTGTFADRSGAAYFAVQPNAHGWFRVYSRVIVDGDGWQLEPIQTLPVDPISTEP